MSGLQHAEEFGEVVFMRVKQKIICEIIQKVLPYV